MSAAHREFDALSRTLAQRWHGASVQACDWLRRETVSALRLDTDQACIEVVLKDGASARMLPLASRGVPLRAIRAPALVAQRAPPRLTLGRTQEDGTATALVRDRLNGHRCYLLTCGHVVAPDAAARFGDRVRIVLSSVAEVVGQLREWQPAPGLGHAPSALDAALVELDEGALALLSSQSSAWLPRGLADDTTPGRTVALQRAAGGLLAGRLMGLWSGEVHGIGGEFPDYFLESAVSYRTDSPTIGGDSGAALWSEGDALLGMHVGAIDGASPAAGPNAVMTRVRPALEWFCVKPFTRDDPATLGPDDWPPLPAKAGGAGTGGIVPAEAAMAEPVADTSDAARTVLAQTLWGEARGEGTVGMEAVAAVILNRWRTRYRRRQSIQEVCLDPKQFSCWNADDPNLPLLGRIDRAPDADFRDALQIAARALDGRLPDPTFGSRHYVATTLRPSAMPDWLRGKSPVVVIGRHAFYNDIL